MRHATRMLTALALAATTAVSGCNYGPPPPPPTKGALNVVFEFPSLGAYQCTATIRWTLVARVLTGPDGNSGPIDQTQTYSFANAGDTCQLSWGALGLRTGTWDLAGSGVGGCTVNVTAGLTTARLRQNVPGCVQG